MFTNFQNQLTYYGVLDDVVDRYPWPARLDLRAIRLQLITSAIYGKRILINDGYLLANPMLIGDLSNIGESLTGALLRSGVARLFTRSGGTKLAEGIERTAEHVKTHRILVSDKKRWPRLRDELELLSEDVGHRNIAWPRDKNMGHIFYLLIERVAGLPEAEGETIVPKGLRRDFDAIFRRFEKMRNPSFDGARTYWEEACWQHFAGRDIDPHALGTIRMEKERVQLYPEYLRVVPFMNLANEIYHLAYSAGASRSVELSDDPKLSGATLGVASALITAFPDLAGPEAVVEDDGIDSETLRRMNQLVISLPSDIEFGSDFNFVFNIRRETNTVETGKAYLAGLEAFARGAIDFAEAIRRRDAYVEHLSRHMAPKLRSRKRWVGVKGLGSLALAAATVKLPFAASWLLSFGVDSQSNRLIERMLKARLANALTEEGRRLAAAGISPDGKAPVALARTLGLYLGPLKHDGLKQLVARVGPHPAVRAVASLPPPDPQSSRP